MNPYIFRNALTIGESNSWFCKYFLKNRCLCNFFSIISVNYHKSNRHKSIWVCIFNKFWQINEIKILFIEIEQKNSIDKQIDNWQTVNLNDQKKYVNKTFFF